MNAYKNGRLCKLQGHSIFYNPFRNKGTVENYLAWIDGWNSL